MEAKKTRDEAKQQGYDLGVAETEETLRVEVLTMCHIYCSQTWDEALNQAGVEASSKLRKPENIYYPSTIRASNLLSTQGEAFIVADLIKEMQSQDPPPPSQQEQTKELETPKEVSSNKAAKVQEDGAASQGFEQALALVTVLAREAPKEKKEMIPTEADKPASKTSKTRFK